MDIDQTVLSRRDAELSLTLYGKTFTETDYRRARRHNVLRWLMSMSLGIPVLILLIVLLSSVFYAALAGSVVLPGIFAGMTRIFPCSKDHGTTIFKKFASYRELHRHRRNHCADRIRH